MSEETAPMVLTTTVPMFDPGAWQQMLEVARTLGHASILPDHLKAAPAFAAHLNKPTPAQIREAASVAIKTFGQAEVARQMAEAVEATVANCLLVVNAARRWGFDPLAVAGSCYVVGGKLAYEGKLVHALINRLCPLSSRLVFEYNEATGDNLTVSVSGTMRGETVPRCVTVRVGDVKTSNQMWSKDPRQKLVYTGAVKWARAHWPEGVLGVLTDDDKEVIEAQVVRNVTPRPELPATVSRTDQVLAKARQVNSPGKAPGGPQDETPAQGTGEAPQAPPGPAQADSSADLPTEEPDPFGPDPITLSDEDVDAIVLTCSKGEIDIGDFQAELGTPNLFDWYQEVTDAETKNVRWATRAELHLLARNAYKKLKAAKKARSTEA